MMTFNQYLALMESEDLHSRNCITFDSIYGGDEEKQRAKKAIESDGKYGSLAGFLSKAGEADWAWLWNQVKVDSNTQSDGEDSESDKPMKKRRQSW